MPRLGASLGLVIFWIITTPAQASEWETRLERNGIVVESRRPENKLYEEFRATVEVGAPLPAAIALLKDNEACTEWMFRCKESRLIEEISPTERTFYQRTGLPFPAKDRDAIFHARITFDETGTARVTMAAQPDALPETRHIRLRDASGTYLLEPDGDGSTLVTWQQYVDPAGALPRWLVNAMLTDLPYRSLEKFRDLVTRPPYVNTTWVLDNEGNRIGISPAGGAVPSGQSPAPQD